MRKNSFKQLMLIVFLFTMQAVFGTLSAKPVSGKVTSATDGEPLIGATVQVQGSKNGIVTDLDGNYTINAEQGQTLVFSYVGYLTKTVKVGGVSTINVTLEEDRQSLEEVVVIGYAMQGQTPGVSIQSTSGQPGSSLKVQIRGLGTVGSSGPLYLIDGIGGDINSLNPADIESIDVLKDAASAAIYGAQAANGVVLVTTKNGRAGKAEISFDTYYGWQNVARKANMLNSQEYMTIMNEQQINSGNQPYDFTKMTSIYDPNGNLYDTNWIDQMFKSNAKVESYNLGITGGNKVSTYALSLGYMSQEGIVGGKDVSNYERYNFRINSEHNIIENLLKVGEQVSFVYTKTTGIGVGNQYNNTLRGAFGTSPLAPVYATNIYDGSQADAGAEASNYNGFYGSPYNATDYSDWYQYDGNPYGNMMTNTNNENKSGTFSGNVYAELTPLKGLKLRSVFGAVYSTSEYRGFSPLYHFSPYNYNDTRTSASQSMSHGLSMTWTNTAQYDWTIKDEHAFSALVGIEASRYSGTSVSGSNGYLKEGFDDWAHAYVNNGTATSTDDGLGAGGSPHGDSRNVSYFGRIGWNWKETYMINATLRADGSSKFASGHRFGWFPSVSAGWTISNEKFMQSISSWIDFLKLRVSWGQVGNQNISDYQYLAPVKNTNTHYLFGTSGYDDTESVSVLGTNWGAYPSRVANPDVTWETSEQFNIGIDARLIAGHLNVNLDYYIKTTKDWLVTAPVLATVGTGAPTINGGDVKNKGFEFNLAWNDMIGKLQADVKPGDVKYIDVNHDGVINDDDKVDLGNGMPDFTYGFTLGFDWKGLDFSVLASGSAGQKIVQTYRNHANAQANYTTEILQRWTGEGTSNSIPRVTTTNINWQFSDLYVHDADYLRISTVTLGYDLARIWKNKYCKQLRVYVQAQNLLTFTKYKGMDPEIGYGTDGWVSGVDVGYYPRPRTFLIGANVKF